MKITLFIAIHLLPIGRRRRSLRIAPIIPLVSMRHPRLIRGQLEQRLPLPRPLLVAINEPILSILAHLLPLPSAPERARVLLNVLQGRMQRFAQNQIPIVQTPHGQRSGMQQAVALKRKRVNLMNLKLLNWQINFLFIVNPREWYRYNSEIFMFYTMFRSQFMQFCTGSYFQFKTGIIMKIHINPYSLCKFQFSGFLLIFLLENVY